jgi:UDP-N-acetyl-D-glucosamine dehydrogenase
VGLPLAMRFSEAGFKVIGLDVDPVKTEMINAGISYINHIKDEDIKNAISRGFRATTDYSEAKVSDALIMCLPTPLDRHREPDLSFVTNTIESLLPYLSAGQVVSLESTTYPGTTDEELKPRIENTGLTIGKEIFLVYSPEREDPGNTDYTTRTIPKICSGATKTCLEVGVALYDQVIDQVIPVSTTRVAEMAKLLENIHRAVNIGLVNEMKIVADRMGINIHEVIDAAATKPFGFVPYYPGPGLGGHCIPIDPFYLSWKAREYDINARFIELAGEVNSSMPEWVVNKIAEGLNRHKKSVNGSRILVLGIAYKKNVDDMRESPAVEIMRLLQEKGAEIAYSDPYVPHFPRMRRYKFSLSSEKLNSKSLKKYDCAVLVTDHDEFDCKLISDSGILLVDTRGVYRSQKKNIITA